MVRANRKGRAVARLSGEVLEPVPRVQVPAPGEMDPWTAHPVPQRSGQPVYVLREEHHHHHPAPAADASSIRWDRLAAYVVGLAMLVLVVCLLLAAGVVDLHALRPPWQETGR